MNEYQYQDCDSEHYLARVLAYTKGEARAMFKRLIKGAIPKGVAIRDRGPVHGTEAA